jgi:hypothetical protein
MTTKNKEPNTTVPRDEAAERTPVPIEESDAAGRGSDPTTTVPHDVPPDTTVPRDVD